MKKKHQYIFLFLIINISFFACEKATPIVETYKEEFEIEDHIIIGSTMSTQIANMPEKYTILDNDRYKEAYGYMTQLLNTLKLTSVVRHRKDFDWDITILHDDAIKTAFTLPGGHIYIYTGLLKFIKAEHELMAVLGNEIAYADKELVTIALLEVHGGVLLGDIILGKKVEKLPKIVADIPAIEFTNDKITTADDYAIELLCPFQYDITGLEKFIERAQASQIQWIHSKQGDIGERLQRIKIAAAECGIEGVTNVEQYQRKIKNYLP